MFGGLFVIVALLAVALLLSGGVAGSGNGPELANAGCRGVNGSVEVVSRYPKAFATQYKKKLKIAVYNRTGNVKKWHLKLYTYSGYKLGSSKEKKWLTWGNKASIRLRQAMQPGGYTVVLKGEIPGCGSSETSDSVRLRGCLNKLPVKFPGKPTGKAADYNSGGYVSVPIEPRSDWAPIKKITSTLTDANGTIYGRAELPRGSRKLIGKQFLNHELTRNLGAGEYSVFVEGKAPQPRSCGDSTKRPFCTSSRAGCCRSRTRSCPLAGRRLR